MWIDVFKRLLFSDNPSVIEWKVKEALENGEDLCANPFVFRGQFCQWMAKVRMPKGLELENAVAVAGGGVSITPVLQMVERVQFLGDFSFSKFSFGGAV